MSRLNIIEISPDQQMHIQIFLDYLKQNEFDFQFSHFQDFRFEDLNSSSDLVLVNPTMSFQIYPLLTMHTTNVRLTQCLDSFMPENGKWYPRLFLFDALRELIVERIRNIDRRFGGYIIGDSDEVRIAAAVLVNVGLKQIILIGEDEQKCQDHAQVLRRNFLGIDFRVLPAHAITTTNLMGSLVVNTIDLQLASQLATDLAYFNYLNPTGVIIDMHFANEDGPLVREAVKAGIQAHRCFEVYAYRDLQIMLHFFPKRFFDIDEYMYHMEKSISNIHTNNNSSNS